MGGTKTPKYVQIDGHRYPASFLPELVRSAINYRPKADDVFVATYPKCGTTWMLQIVMAIMRKGDLPKETHEYFESCPFLEMLGEEELKNMPGPGPIKIHLPFDLTPYSPEAKYIYVARNPKDCCISFYHHTKFFPGYFFNDGTFDDFFELFLKGETDYDDYFDHLLSWYQHRNDPNVFFITFEELKADHRGVIKKLADFLGDKYSSALEANEDLLDKIVHLSSFSYMKNNNNGAWKEMIDMSAEFSNDVRLPRGVRSWAKLCSQAIRDGQGSIGQFVRNGKISQDKTILSEEQERRLQERIQEKTKGSDVMNLWKNLQTT